MPLSVHQVCQVADYSTKWLTTKINPPIFNHMVKHDSLQLDTVFQALSDATRRGMLSSLALGEKTVGELAQPFAMSLAGASKHVKVLEEAGLIRREVRGRTHVCTLEAGPLASADQWLRHYEHFWTSRLDALEKLLREDDARKAEERRARVSGAISEHRSRKNQSPKGEKQ